MAWVGKTLPFISYCFVYSTHGKGGGRQRGGRRAFNRNETDTHSYTYTVSAVERSAYYEDVPSLKVLLSRDLPGHIRKSENFIQRNWHPGLPRIRRSRDTLLDRDVWWCILRNII